MGKHEKLVIRPVGEIATILSIILIFLNSNINVPSDYGQFISCRG
jgi:hypothetical protein